MIVDRLTKVAYFILVRETNIVKDLSRKYVDQEVKHHVSPFLIVIYQGTQFTLKFWSIL